MRKILATLSVGTLMVLAAPGIAQASSGMSVCDSG